MGFVSAQQEEHTVPLQVVESYKLIPGTAVRVGINAAPANNAKTAHASDISGPTGFCCLHESACEFEGTAFDVLCCVWREMLEECVWDACGSPSCATDGTNEDGAFVGFASKCEGVFECIGKGLVLVEYGDSGL